MLMAWRDYIIAIWRRTQTVAFLRLGAEFPPRELSLEATGTGQRYTSTEQAEDAPGLLACGDGFMGDPEQPDVPPAAAPAPPAPKSTDR